MGASHSSKQYLYAGASPQSEVAIKAMNKVMEYSRLAMEKSQRPTSENMHVALEALTTAARIKGQLKKLADATRDPTITLRYHHATRTFTAAENVVLEAYRKYLRQVAAPDAHLTELMSGLSMRP